MPLEARIFHLKKVRIKAMDEVVNRLVKQGLVVRIERNQAK